MKSGKSTLEEQRKYLIGTRGVRFLFDKNIAEYMDKHIWAPAMDLECLESELEGISIGDERTKAVHKQREIKTKFHQELKSLEDRFAICLQFRH